MSFCLRSRAIDDNVTLSKALREITAIEGADHDGGPNGPRPDPGRRVTVAPRAGGGGPERGSRRPPERGGRGEDARRPSPEVVADRAGNPDLRGDDRLR